MAKRKKHRRKSSSEHKSPAASKRVDKDKASQKASKSATARSKAGKRVWLAIFFVSVVVVGSIYGFRALSVHTEQYHYEGKLAGESTWTWKTQLRYRLSGGGLVRAYQVKDGVLPDHAEPEVEDLVIQVDGKDVRYDSAVKEALVKVDWKQEVRANAYGREVRFRLPRVLEEGKSKADNFGAKISFGVLRVQYGVVTRLDLAPPKGKAIPEVVRFQIPSPELKTVVAVFPETPAKNLGNEGDGAGIK